jgi:hypothetical protein
MVCAGDAYMPSKPLTLAPGAEYTEWGQLMNKDLRANVCEFVEDK